MPSNHLILCRLLLLPSIFPRIRVFSNESALLIRWPKYWSFNLIISPSNEYPGLISFRVDWFDLLAVQEALKSLLQHHLWILEGHNILSIRVSKDSSLSWVTEFFQMQLWFFIIGSNRLSSSWLSYFYSLFKQERQMTNEIVLVALCWPIPELWVCSENDSYTPCLASPEQ